MTQRQTTTEKAPPAAVFSRVARDATRSCALAAGGGGGAAAEETAARTVTVPRAASRPSTGAVLTTSFSAPPKRIIRPPVEKSKSGDDEAPTDGLRDTESSVGPESTAAGDGCLPSPQVGRSESGLPDKPQHRRRPSYQPSTLYAALPRAADTPLVSSLRLSHLSNVQANAAGSFVTPYSVSPADDSATNSPSSVGQNTATALATARSSSSVFAGVPEEVGGASVERTPRRTSNLITSIPETDDPVELKAAMERLLKQYEHERFVSAAYRRKVSTQQQQQQQQLRQQQQQQQQQPSQLPQEQPPTSRPVEQAPTSPPSSTLFPNPLAGVGASSKPLSNGVRQTSPSPQHCEAKVDRALLKTALEQPQQQQRTSAQEAAREPNEGELPNPASGTRGRSASSVSASNPFGTGDGLAAEELPASVTGILFNPHASNEELRQALRQCCLQYAVLQRRVRELEQSPGGAGGGWGGHYHSASRSRQSFPSSEQHADVDDSDEEVDGGGRLRPLPAFYTSHRNGASSPSLPTSSTRGAAPGVSPSSHVSPAVATATAVTGISGRQPEGASDAAAIPPSNSVFNCTAEPHTRSASSSLVSSLVSPHTGGGASEGLSLTPHKANDGGGYTTTSSIFANRETASAVNAASHPSSGSSTTNRHSNNVSDATQQQTQTHGDTNVGSPSLVAEREGPRSSISSTHSSCGPRPKTRPVSGRPSPTSTIASTAAPTTQGSSKSVGRVTTADSVHARPPHPSDEAQLVREQLRQLHEETTGVIGGGSRLGSFSSADDAARRKEDEEREALRQWRAEASKRNSNVRS